VGETDLETLEAIADGPLSDMRSRLGGREGESGIGLD
jgi:hypothetical protein